MLANLLIIEFQFDKYQQAEKDEKKALHTREGKLENSYVNKLFELSYIISQISLSPFYKNDIK